MSKIKTVLLNDMPKPASPWRTDIENAPRDGRDILIVCKGDTYVVYPENHSVTYSWQSRLYFLFANKEITHWTPIPKLPK